MNIPVMRVEQAGRLLYLGRMTASDLLAMCITDEWNPALGWDAERQGYQRAPVEKHYRAIGRFLSDHEEPFMPTGALLSAREPEYGVLEFNRIAGAEGFDFGELVIPDGRQLFIVDYQHRWRGFRHAIDDLGARALADYVIPVIIMTQVSPHEEILQFYLINSKQRRIDTALGLALLQTMAGGGASKEELYSLVGPGKRHRVRATPLAFKIAGSRSGPWAGRIKPPHDAPEPGAVLTLNSFADSLAPIVSRRSPVSHLGDHELLGVLDNYWQAIGQLMPEAFADPRHHSVQKTPGVFSMHIVAAKTVLPICRRGDNMSRDKISQILSAASQYMKSDFWVSLGPVKVYGGSGGHRELARLIREDIEKQFPA